MLETIGVHDQHSHTGDKCTLASQRLELVGCPESNGSANNDTGWWSLIKFSICEHLASLSVSLF
jgi:hypothetical protein